MEKPDNILHKIATKRVPAEIIFENQHALAVLDVQPIAPGHALVIPKSYARDMSELNEEAIAGVFMAVREVTVLLGKALRAEGFTIGINQGRAAGGAIDYLHVHVVPRYMNDKGVSLHQVVHNPPREDIHTIAERIRAA